VDDEDRTFGLLRALIADGLSNACETSGHGDTIAIFIPKELGMLLDLSMEIGEEEEGEAALHRLPFAALGGRRVPAEIATWSARRGDERKKREEREELGEGSDPQDRAIFRRSSRHFEE